MKPELQALVERLLVRRSSPMLDERVIMKRISGKIERAAARLGAMPSSGVQAVTRCAGIVVEHGGQRYIETGECAIVGALPIVREEPKELVN